MPATKQLKPQAQKFQPKTHRSSAAPMAKTSGYGFGPMPALAERMGDARFAAAQRQAMAVQVGKVAGNQYLQRKLSQVQNPAAIQRSWFDDIIGGAKGVLDSAANVIEKVWEEVSQGVSDAGIKTVISNKAMAFSDPPKLRHTGEQIPYGTRVSIVKTVTDGKKKFSLIEDYLPPGMPGPKRQWWTERSNLGWVDPLVLSALHTVKSQNLGREAIAQLQEKLGIPATGIYDMNTVEEVIAYQEAKHLRRTGVADAQLFRRLGLIYTQEITAGSADDALLAEIEKRFPDGITIAIYTDYDDERDSFGQSNLTFPENARPFADRQGAVGLEGGKITIGKAMGIKRLGQVVEHVQSVHQGLLKQYRQRQRDNGLPDDGGIPAFTQVKNLALFAHGGPHGIGLDSRDNISKGLAITERTGTSLIESFVKGLGGATSKSINVQLYACSTGRDIGTKNNWMVSHEEGVRGGENSFAAALVEAFGEEASVFAHFTRGHTTENFASRAFGKAAGGGKGGLHIFTLLYDRAFVSSELERLFPDQTAEEREGIRAALQDMMWDHFRDSISTEHHRKKDEEHTVCTKDKKGVEKCTTYGPKEYERPLGQEMFINMANARTLMHQNWQDRWVPAHMADIKKLVETKKK